MLFFFPSPEHTTLLPVMSGQGIGSPSTSSGWGWYAPQLGDEDERSDEASCFFPPVFVALHAAHGRWQRSTNSGEDDVGDENGTAPHPAPELAARSFLRSQGLDWTCTTDVEEFWRAPPFPAKAPPAVDYERLLLGPMPS